MKTKTTKFHKKLKAYSALAGTFAAVGSADAQVIYTDVMPDSTVSDNGVYMLDLNNDDIADFKLEQRSGTFSSIPYDAVLALALAPNNAIDTSGGSGAASALNIGVNVDATLNWVDSTQAANIYPIPTANGLALSVPMFYEAGNFKGAGEKFLPLRFENLGSTYYGWVRLDVANDAKSFKVIDYAYTDDPDHSTVTGDMVGISEAALKNNISIFAYNNSITVELDPSAAVNGVIEITNSLGQTISTTPVTKTSTIIAMENGKTGIYLVTVKQAHSSYTKRVFVK
ncbi:MAG: hypothetical protein K0S44_1926 [Bacteroidetes bacterium]|jgi:hypothetical protein|nr:hypothetical protein [Bacteroidota bacterium]